MPEVNYYEILGVSREAPTEVIKAAYRAHAKVKHPDRDGGGQEFAMITAAYQVLSDPEQRRRHDADLDAAGAGQPAAADTGGVDDWGEPIDDTGWGEPQPPGPAPQANGAPPAQPAPDFASQDPRILAGYDAWASMPLTPEQLSWNDQAARLRQGERPAAVTRAVPAMSTGKGGLRHIALVAWLASCVLLGAFGASAGYGVGAFLGGIAFGLARARNLSGCLPTGAYLLYYPIALLMVPVGGVYLDSAAAFLPLVPAVAYGFAVESWRRKHQGDQERTPPAPLLPADVVEQNFQWGNPGGHLLTGKNTFTARNATLGFGGEILTSQLIDVFRAIPGVRVVHGLVPGRGEADIDHAILCGNRLVLVDSKNWAGGDYYWLSGQVMSTTADGVLPRGNPMHWARPILARAFPRMEVRPVVVIHSHNGAPVRTNNQGRDGGAELMTPVEFVETIGHWLVEAGGKKIDRRALSQLVAWAE